MMHVKLDLINKAKSVLLDTIYLEYRPAIQIVKSKEIPADASDTLQYKILGEHMAYRKEKDYSLGHAVAGIVDMKTALNPNINKTITIQSFRQITMKKIMTLLKAELIS